MGIEAVSKRVYEVEDITELDNYSAVLLGSATYNKDMMGTMKTFLFKMEKANLKGKVGASFGAYGWSGEAVEMLSETMQNIFGMDVVKPKANLPGSANGTDKSEQQNFGGEIAKKILAGKK
jgi:flavorubredoxin